MYRHGPAFRILTKIAEAFGQFLCDPQLLRRESNFDPAVRYDFVRAMLTIDIPQLGAGLDDGEQTQPIAAHIRERVGNDLDPKSTRLNASHSGAARIQSTAVKK